MSSTITVDLKNQTKQGFSEIRSDSAKTGDAIDELSQITKLLAENQRLLAKSITDTTVTQEAAIKASNEESKSLFRVASEASALHAILRRSKQFREAEAAGVVIAKNAWNDYSHVVTDVSVKTHARAVESASRLGVQLTSNDRAVRAVSGSLDSLRNPLGRLIVNYPQLQGAMERVGLGAVSNRAALRSLGDEMVSTTTKITASQLATRSWLGTIGSAASGIANTANITTGATLALSGYRAAWGATGKVVDKETGAVTTNLDRVDKAMGDLASDFGAFAAGSGEAAMQVISGIVDGLDDAIPVVSLAKAGWKEFDAATTRSVNQMVENLRLIGSAVRGVERDVVEASERVDAAQEAAADDFARVRDADKELAALAKARGEAERLAGFQTVAAIDAELARMKERRGQQAADNKFTEEAQKKYISDVQTLESRRNQIEDAAREKRKAAREKEIQQRKDDWAEENRRYDEALSYRNKKADEHNAKLKRRDEEYVEYFAKIQAEKVEEWVKSEQRIVAEAKRRSDERKEILKREHDERVKMLDSALGERNVIGDLRGRLDPREVAKEVGRQRGERARRQFVSDNMKGVDFTDSDAVRRFREQADRAGQRASEAGFNLARRGRVSADDIRTAQNAIIGRRTDQLAAGLDPRTGAALRESVGGSLRASDLQAANQRMMDQISSGYGGQRLTGATGSLAGATGQLADVAGQGVTQAISTATAAETKAQAAMDMILQANNAAKQSAARQRAQRGAY